MKGIVIACPQRYETICLNNITALRENHNCQLPIEIWEIGQEITPSVKNLMKTKNVIFKNVCDYCENPEHWKGYQVKVFALYHSEFSEPILCDADVTFFINPEIIFHDENYQRTGSYFFKDMDNWQFYNLSYANTEKFRSLTFFNERKNFIKKLIPKKTNIFPKEWSYIYDEYIPISPVKEALQEAGVVYINKNIHQKSLDYIFQLNDNHKDTYNYVLGDKETFWIGCVMANKEYYFNDNAGFFYNGCLSHTYKGYLFWKQK